MKTANRISANGFSLLEVMIALAIFGITIVGILSAQAGVAATNRRAVTVGQAIDLARCKMTEMEEKLGRDGYPDLDVIDTAALCCEGTDLATFTCDTRVEKVLLPNPPGMDGSDGGASGALSLATPGASGSAGGPLMNLSGQLDLDAGLNNIASALGPQAGNVPKGSSGMLGMVMGFVYPTMKPLMENSIRRLTVAVHWNEGPQVKDFTIVQYVTNPARGGFQSGSTLDGGALAPGASSTRPASAGAPGAASPITPSLGGGLLPGR